MKKLLCVLCSLLILVGCGGGGSDEVVKKDYSTATSVADFEGSRIAGQEGTVHADLAAQVAYETFTEYPSIPDELIALKSGAVDGFVCEEPQAITNTAIDDSITYIKLVNNDNGFKTTEELSALAIGCAKGSDLTEKINAIMKDAGFDSAKQTALMEVMGKIAVGVAAEQNVLVYEDVDSDLVLRVGMECDSSPYNWTDTEKSATNYPIANAEGYYADGYDVQVSAYVAYKLGMKLEVYAYEWDSLIPAVQTGSIDAIIAGMSPTAKRKEVIDFTDTYYDTNFVIVVNK